MKHKFGIFKDEICTSDYLEISRKLDGYWTSRGFDIADDTLPRYIVLNDSQITLQETGHLHLHYGATGKRTSVLESVLGLYRMSPSSRNNAFKLAVLVDGEVISHRKLPTGCDYIFCPKTSKLYANKVKGRGISLDTSTGEVIDGKGYSFAGWKVYDVISYEANTTGESQ